MADNKFYRDYAQHYDEIMKKKASPEGYSAMDWVQDAGPNTIKFLQGTVHDRDQKLSKDIGVFDRGNFVDEATEAYLRKQQGQATPQDESMLNSWNEFKKFGNINTVIESLKNKK